MMSRPVSHSSVFDPSAPYFRCLHFPLLPPGLITLEILLTYQLASSLAVSQFPSFIEEEQRSRAVCLRSFWKEKAAVSPRAPP